MSGHFSDIYEVELVNDGGYSDKIVSNAPETIDDTFTVPKVIE